MQHKLSHTLTLFWTIENGGNPEPMTYIRSTGFIPPFGSCVRNLASVVFTLTFHEIMLQAPQCHQSKWADRDSWWLVITMLKVGLQTGARQSFECKHKNKHKNHIIMCLRPLASSHLLIGRNGEKVRVQGREIKNQTVSNITNNGVG